MKAEHFKKLGINIAVLFLFGVLVWLGYRLFTHSVGVNPIIGVVIFIACVAGWILLIRLMESRKYRWVRPSLKLTTFCLIAVILVLSFAGVQPLSDYKDSVISDISARFSTAGIPVSESPPIPYGVYCDQSGWFFIKLDKDHLYSTNIFSGDVEAGTYSVGGELAKAMGGDSITFTNEVTHEVHMTRYAYSESSKFLYLYLHEVAPIIWGSGPTTFFVCK